MVIYNVSKSNAALSLTADIFTIVSASVRSFLILEIDVEGDGNTSSYNECGIYRVATAGVTPAGAIVPSPVADPATATAFAGTVNGSYSTPPVVGALIHNIPVNANGQRYFWRCNPNLNNAIFCRGGAVANGSLSVGRSISGTSNVSIRIQIGEL